MSLMTTLFQRRKSQSFSAFAVYSLKQLKLLMEQSSITYNGLFEFIIFLRPRCESCGAVIALAIQTLKRETLINDF